MIQINIYRTRDGWYGARWIDGEYDGCDALDCDPGSSAAEAIAFAQEMPLRVTGTRSVNRVSDVGEPVYLITKAASI